MYLFLGGGRFENASFMSQDAEVMMLRLTKGFLGTHLIIIARETCISLLRVPGKIYVRILNEKMMKITDKSVGGEQGCFRKGRGCVDQIFAVKILVEKYLEKDRKLVAAFMDLEKAYDRVYRKGLWETENVWGGRAIA